MNEVRNLFSDKELDTFEIGTKVIVFFFLTMRQVRLNDKELVEVQFKK